MRESRVLTARLVFALVLVIPPAACTVTTSMIDPSPLPATQSFQVFAPDEAAR
jgi:hypothetical protein